MYRHVIMTSGGLMLSGYYREEYRTYREVPSAKEVKEARNKQLTLDQKKLRAKHFSRQRFAR